MEIIGKHAYLKAGKYNNKLNIVEILKASGYDIRFGPMVRKDTDTTLVCDLLGEQDLVEGIMLCSGDADFEPALQRMKDAKKQIFIISNYNALSVPLSKYRPIFLIDTCKNCLGTGIFTKENGEKVVCLTCRGLRLYQQYF